ncbi:MAG: ATP-grasp domain-containing protein [Eubacteriales bacterium]|nr:ATP-grasp domain-containing protein [Eubacteriales bacterium]
MNVLLTSVGRRAYMVKYFKEALGKDGEVHVCNSDSKSIAFKYADRKVVAPLIYDENYIPFLLNYCKDNSINILISLFDIDLLMLAKHKKQFEEIGTKVIVSDLRVVEICNDKWKTYQFLKENGFHAPESFLNLSEVISTIALGKLSYPIVVKPRYGCGSISVAIAYDEEDLRYLTKKANKDIANSYLKYESTVTEDKVIYQECLRGQEYGADIINDLNGKNRNVIVRKKLAMRSGETDIAELVEEPIIHKELEKLGNITGHIANMDCDVFLIDGVPYILEMNARFGGGYPFSHMGGCNLPKAIVEWVKGKKVNKDLISSKTGITGFKEIYITEL